MPLAEEVSMGKVVVMDEVVTAGTTTGKLGRRRQWKRR